MSNEETKSETPEEITAASVAEPTSEKHVEATEETVASEKSPSTELDFIEALKQVIDPELFVNIVDLGLIYSVEQDEEDERKVKVDMTLTSPSCPAGPQLVQQAKMALERLHDIDTAAINIVMSPPWSPERMTDDARDELGIF